MPKPELPFLVSFSWLFVVFGGSLAVFHFMFVWLLPLGRLRWKQVEYVWLSCAFLGIAGSVGGARSMVAQGLLVMAEDRAKAAASEIISRIEFGASGAVCRTFVRTDYSPPPEEFERLQAEFDALCFWFKEAAKLAPAELATRKKLTIQQIGISTPPVAADPWAVESLVRAIKLYNDCLDSLAVMSAATERTEVESIIAILGPFMLAVALSLRITKVTGEILLDRAHRGSESDNTEPRVNQVAGESIPHVEPVKAPSAPD